MKKIIFGTVFVSVLLFSGFNSEEVYTTYRDCNSSKDIAGNNIDRKNVCIMSIPHNMSGKTPYGYGWIITQVKNPCMFAVKGYDYEKYKPKKINSNSVYYYANVFMSSQRPELGHNIKHRPDGSMYVVSPNGKVISEVVQILGTSKTCYLNPTKEIWSTKYREKVSRATFYLR